MSLLALVPSRARFEIEPSNLSLVALAIFGFLLTTAFFAIKNSVSE